MKRKVNAVLAVIVGLAAALSLSMVGYSIAIENYMLAVINGAVCIWNTILAIDMGIDAIRYYDRP